MKLISVIIPKIYFSFHFRHRDFYNFQRDLSQMYFHELTAHHQAAAQFGDSTRTFLDSLLLPPAPRRTSSSAWTSLLLRFLVT